MNYQDLLGKLRVAAEAAGQAILEIYASDDLGIEYKQDESPLTRADKSSHDILVKYIKAIDSSPILSEEGGGTDWAVRASWSRYWLLDPLDGTKEFIKKNGEFTVNIALIENGVPTLGVVLAPALGVSYFGGKGVGAFKNKANSTAAMPIQVAKEPQLSDLWKIVGSRSHQSEEFSRFIEKFPNKELVSMGSSLKLCLIAEGAADLYPRLGLTSEWDTAAAQAVVEAAGGNVINLETLEPLRYNTKESLLNPFFVVCSTLNRAWLPANQ